MLFGVVSLLLNAVSALAAISIIQPSSSLWWVNNGVNTLAWTGQAPPNDFVVFLSNPTTTLLTTDVAIGAIAQTFMFSLTITPVKWNPGPGYTIKLVNPLNTTEVYTQSEPFEIKPEGSTYATVPTNAGVSSAAGTLSASVGASGVPAGSSAVPAPSKPAGAMANAVPAVAAAAFGAAAYILV